MKRLDGFWLSFLQAVLMGAVLLVLLFVLGEVWRVGIEPAPTPTMTPLPLPTIVTLVPITATVPFTLVLPTVTPKPFVLPTATPEPDVVMTEIHQSVESGALLAFIDATPVVMPTLLGTPIALCNPNYRGVCIPSGLTRAFCYDLGDKGFVVIGVDVLRLDGDNDGSACEIYEDWQPN